MGSRVLDVLTGSNTNYLEKTQRELENTRRRLGAVGYGEDAQPETSESFLTKVFDFLGRFGHGGTGALSEVLSPGLGVTPNQFDPFSAFARGFKKEETLVGKDIARYHGLSEEPLFGKGWMPSPAGIAGLGLDIFNPADPVNWLTFGVGGAVAKAGYKGLPLLERAFGAEGASRLAGELGEGAVKGLRGNTVADLVNSIVESNPEAVKTLQELTKGINLKKRLPTEQKSLTMGLSAPIINAKLAEVAIPGSKPIVTNLSKLGTSFMQTSLGESLGKGFSTLHRVSGKATKGEFFRVQRELLGGDGPPPITKVSTGEVNQTLQDIFSGTNDAMRKNINDTTRFLEESARGIPEMKLNQLSLELSPQGRFTLLFDLYGKQGGIDEIQKLTDELGRPVFTKQEAEFSSLWDDFRKQVPKWFDEHGVHIDELPSYMTHLFKRPPTQADIAALWLGKKAEVKPAEGSVTPPEPPDGFDKELLKVAQAQMPQLKKRVLTSGYMSPQDINRTLTETGMKPLAVENLYEIMSTVGERFIRAQYAVEALEKLRSSFAMYADDLRMAGKSFIPDGYGVYKLKVDEKTGQMSLVRAEGAEEGQFLAHLSTKKEEAPQNVFALPDEIAKAWEDYSKLHYDPIERNNFLRFFDKATSEFRTLAYMVTPGHVPRDLVSNLYNLWLMGMRSVTSLPQMWKLSRMIEKDIIFVTPAKGKVPPVPNDNWTYLNNGKQGVYASTDGKEAVAFVTKQNADAVASMLNKRVTDRVSYYDMIDQANRKGVLDTGWWSLEGPDTRMLALAPMRKRLLTLDPQKHEYVRRMVQVTKTTDNTTRLMGFVDRLSKGDDFATAAAQVKKYLFDYSDLTSFEKTWMRRIFPFYTWMRKNIPLQIKEAFRQPGKIATVGKYHRAASEEQEPGATPSFLEQGASMLLPGGDMFLTSPLPYQDLGRLPMDWQTISEQLANVNPMLRVPIELAMNKQFFSGLPIEQYAKEPAKGLLGELGLDRRGPAYALENIPLYRNVATMTPQVPESGPLNTGNISSLALSALLPLGIPISLLSLLQQEEGDDTTSKEDRQLARILSFMAGPQVFSAERAKEIATYEERDRLRALVRLLKDQGIEVPGIKDIL